MTSFWERANWINGWESRGLWIRITERWIWLKARYTSFFITSNSSNTTGKMCASSRNKNRSAMRSCMGFHCQGSCKEFWAEAKLPLAASQRYYRGEIGLEISHSGYGNFVRESFKLMQEGFGVLPYTCIKQYIFPSLPRSFLERCWTFRHRFQQINFLVLRSLFAYTAILETLRAVNISVTVIAKKK